MPKKLTQEQFLAKAIAVHGSRYDYSRALYMDARSKVLILCPHHGAFKQNAKAHIAGKGCKVCGGKIALDTSSFLERAYLLHGGKYDYSQAECKKFNDKVKIICPHHGPFEQGAGYHLRGQQCPKCSRKQAGNNIAVGLSDFVARAVAMHGAGRYDYSQSRYEAKTNIKIICPKHGVFEQSPHAHLRGHGCRACGIENRKPGHLTNADFIARACQVHRNRYDYSQASYLDSRLKVKIICATHGVFEQTARLHLSGNGCPSCGLDFKTKSMRLGWGAGNQPCQLYLIRLFDAQEEFFKIGVTSRSIAARYKASNLNGYQYELLALHNSKSSKAVIDWEQSILETFAYLRYHPKRSFGGETECFSSADEILSIFPL